MCRLYGLRASEATKVECTLVHAQNALLQQSRGDRDGRTHSDGWGIAYYRDSQPYLERRAAAAYADLHFSSTAERASAKTVVAHVRQATVGESSIHNCHPFQLGNWTFAHNGTVTAIDVLREELLAKIPETIRSHLQGETDSELLFLWLISRLLESGSASLQGCRNLPLMRDVLAQSLVELDEQNERAGADESARLNTILTDGTVMVATRLRNSLVFVERHGIHECEICGGQERDEREYRAVAVASEPLTQEPWQEVPDGSVVTVDAALAVDLRPLALREDRAARQRIA